MLRPGASDLAAWAHGKHPLRQVDVYSGIVTSYIEPATAGTNASSSIHGIELIVVK